MVTGINTDAFIRIRLWAHNLIFFVVFVTVACSERSTEIALVWSGEKAVGVKIPKTLVDGAKDFNIRISRDSAQANMLGSVTDDRAYWLFEPVVPFTRGERYLIFTKGASAGEFEIPSDTSSGSPNVICIYPTQDTLPENLLKFYLLFSKPMREGMSDGCVVLIRNATDTVKGAFLNLQPELWNEDGTLLTLWLDPGRIKRDLSPNTELGAPLISGESYSLRISAAWKDQSGNALIDGYHKEFISSVRDESIPDPTRWEVIPPASNTRSPLVIQFGESLDYSLLMSCLDVYASGNVEVRGNWIIGEEEKRISFVPDEPWETDSYVLRIESRLEDLAANNLNRLFDVDLLNAEGHAGTDAYKAINFSIR